MPIDPASTRTEEPASAPVAPAAAPAPAPAAGGVHGPACSPGPAPEAAGRRLGDDARSPAAVLASSASSSPWLRLGGNIETYGATASNAPPAPPGWLGRGRGRRATGLKGLPPLPPLPLWRASSFPAPVLWCGVVYRERKTEKTEH